VWEIEELHRDVKALGLVLLEEGEASGLPHDLDHDQRRQLIGELNLRSVEVFLRFVERHLGGPPELMKIFKLR